MKITTQKELDDLIATANNSNTITLHENLEITFSCIIPCNIDAYNIEAHDIKAHDINAHDINACDINACDINAHDIDAHDINACDINAHDINACDINAHDIDACNIEAKNIKYYAFCITYQSLKCKSIAGERENSFHKCLDQEIEIIKEDKKVTIELTQE